MEEELVCVWLDWDVLFDTQEMRHQRLETTIRVWHQLEVVEMGYAAEEAILVEILVWLEVKVDEEAPSGRSCW